MHRTGKFVFKLFLLIVSLTLVDGGRIFILQVADNNYNVTAEDDRDIEFPDQLNYSLLTDCDKWIGDKSYNNLSPLILSNRINLTVNIKSQDFIYSIWQPPRF